MTQTSTRQGIYIPLFLQKNKSKKTQTDAWVGIYITDFPLLEKAFGESPPQQSWFRNHQGSVGPGRLSWAVGQVTHTQAGLGQVLSAQSPQKVQLWLLPLLPSWCSFQSSQEFAVKGRGMSTSQVGDFCSSDGASTGLARMMGSWFKPQFLQHGPKVLLLHIALLWQRHLCHLIPLQIRKRDPFSSSCHAFRQFHRHSWSSHLFFAYWEGHDGSNLFYLKHQ